MFKSVISIRAVFKWEFILPLAAFLTAFALRHHFLVTYRFPMMIHEQDAVGYLDIAKGFLNHQIPSVSGRPPGYPVVIALFALLPVGLEFAARLASIFMDALVVFPLFVISRIYLSRTGSFAVSILWAFFYFALIFSPSPLSQSSHLFYLLAGIAFLHLALEKKTIGWFFCAGAFFALAYLARPEGIVGFVCGFLLCLTPFMDKGGLNKKALLFPVCFLFGFLLLAGPYLGALHSVYGSWTVSPMSEAHVKTADAVLTLNAKGELQKTGSTGFSVWKEQYKTIPTFLDAVWGNIQAFAGVYKKSFPMWMHVISGVGLLSLLWRTPWLKSTLLLIPIAVISPSFIVTIPKSSSYLYPVFVLTLLCFVSCFEAVNALASRIFQLFQTIVPPRLLQVVLPGIMLMIISNVALGFYLTANDDYHSPELVREAMITDRIYKGAGEIIKINSQANEVIMTRWGLVGYFAERPILALPKGGVKEVVEYGKKNGAHFIMIDTNSVLSRRQELRELLAPLEGQTVNPVYGIEAISSSYFPGLGGYVIYRYMQ